MVPDSQINLGWRLPFGSLFIFAPECTSEFVGSARVAVEGSSGSRILFTRTYLGSRGLMSVYALLHSSTVESFL